MSTLCVNNGRVVAHHTRPSHVLAEPVSSTFWYVAAQLRAGGRSVTDPSSLRPQVSVRALLWWLSVLSLLSLSLACDSEGRTRAEAHTFLALYAATDHRAPVAERERKIQQLEQLSLSDETVKKARDECVGAHRALLTAERQNEQAAGQLDKAIAGQPSGAALPVADTASIRAGIEAAEASLGDARGRFEKCETQARSLSLRFGAR